MLDPSEIPTVAAEELLARYVLFSKHIRSSDQTVKPDAFVPHPHRDLSVTRHLQATDSELWNVGAQIANSRRCTLYGRADLQAQACIVQNLRVQAAPLPDNPNHADITNWPAEKSQQKMIAIEIAAAATLKARPRAN